MLSIRHEAFAAPGCTKTGATDPWKEIRMTSSSSPTSNDLWDFSSDRPVADVDHAAEALSRQHAPLEDETELKDRVAPHTPHTPKSVEA